MTFAHPGASSARPASARIRILGQEPPPPRRRGPNWTLLAACVVVAGAGVWTTLELRPQTAEDPFQATPVTGSIDVMGLANLAARRPDDHTTAVLHRVRADFAAAARLAERRQATPATASAAPTAAVTPFTSTRAQSPGTPAAADDPASSGDLTVVGPEQPPNPASPNTALDPT
jgi:hypothetical protein